MADLDAETIYLAGALACAVAGAGFDIRSRRIPNQLTTVSAAAAVLLHGVLGGWRGGAASLLALVLCGATFLVFYLAGGMGGGDVKLIAAVGAFAGPSHVGWILIATALAGGVIALLVALVTGRLRTTLLNVLSLLRHHGRHGLQPHAELNLGNRNTVRLPYAIAIAAGVAVTLSAFRLGY